MSEKFKNSSIDYIAKILKSWFNENNYLFKSYKDVIAIIDVFFLICLF
jgi:hypothetical protein